MKKLINDAEQVVPESIEGLGLAHPDLIEVHPDPLFVSRSTATVKERGRVGLVSGGGAGHEPLHAGFVGEGMLDAAVPGPVFTSPTPDAILAATTTANQGAGVVYIVKNYTGDVLNFDTAAELAGAEDIKVEQVLVDDDVAVENSTFTAGRRGVAGTVLVEKVAGAAAERGDDLATVARLARKAVDNVRSMGVALSSCTVPHVGTPSFELGENEVECGVGIHGEPGCERIAMTSANEITDILFDRIVADLGLRAGERVVALVNGMGGTPSSELFIVYRRVVQRLADLGVESVRPMVGNYVTSLEMRGVSLTLLRLDDELEELIDAPAHTIAWTGQLVQTPCGRREVAEPQHTHAQAAATRTQNTQHDAPGTLGVEWATRWIEGCADAAAEHREELIDLDRAIGDADHGANIDRGFRAVREALGEASPRSVDEVLKTAAKTLISTVGGASGPLLGTAFLRASKEAKSVGAELGGVEVAALIEAGLAGIQSRGHAEEGEKTMVDTWAPAARAAREAAEQGADPTAVLQAAAQAAAAGAEATIPLKATKGRASYLGERSVGHKDPGAASSAYFLAAAAAAASHTDEK